MTEPGRVIVAKGITLLVLGITSLALDAYWWFRSSDVSILTWTLLVILGIALSIFGVWRVKQYESISKRGVS